MVYVCDESTPFPARYDDKLTEEGIDQLFPYPLSDFQKYSIYSLLQGNHSLVTAHTGSGKTVPAEFAIQYFCGIQKKRIIYCSPIKSLSNQKYYEFTKKYACKGITFGILTGDIKSNPEADVLIMTTEILMNTLYMKREQSNATNLLFEMDFDRELACVVFDEVHYINDPDRGNVWEQSIIMLPLQVQLLMLSATIDHPEKFAEWIEKRDPDHVHDKKVWISSTHHRVVPLSHYLFLVAPENYFKCLDKERAAELKKTVFNKPLCIQSSTGQFNDQTYHRASKEMELMRKTPNIYVKRPFFLNALARHLKDNNMLPAITFILSRQQVEACAKEITVNLLEDDSKIPYIMERECEHIIRRLPNFKEYMELPEYKCMVSLLAKGIAFHHSGVLPVLREIVEMMVALGHVKLLFATETFAIGLDCPIKTTIFTSVMKFDGKQSRILYGHEYTQMAGRAGRRGIDTVGHVIHCGNLIYNNNGGSGGGGGFPPITDYKNMLKGTPQKLTSKFKISYLLVLNAVQGERPVEEMIHGSMLYDETRRFVDGLQSQIDCLKRKLELLSEKPSTTTAPSSNTVIRFLSLLELGAIGKTGADDIRSKHPGIDQIAAEYNEFCQVEREISRLQTDIMLTNTYLQDEIQCVTQTLIPRFISDAETSSGSGSGFTLTTEGKMATMVREIHCLVMVDVWKKFTQLSAKEMVGFISCFCNLNVPEEAMTLRPPQTLSDPLTTCLLQAESYIDTLRNNESLHELNVGMEIDFHFNLVEEIMWWCGCENENDARDFLEDLICDRGIFLGEFVRAVLKINHVVAELDGVAEFLADINTLSKLRSIEQMILKFVCTNQSLYV